MKKDDQLKEDTIRKCPNCEEINLRYDKINRVWQCLSCGYIEEE